MDRGVGLGVGAHPVSAVRAEGVARRGPGGWVLREVTLDLAAGEVVGICSADRPVRRTLVRVLMGRLAPHLGSVWPHGPVRGSAFVDDPPAVPGELAGIEWLRYVAAHEASSPADRVARVRVAIERGAPHHRLATRTGIWSGAEIRQLAVAAAITGRHRLVGLVEACNGLSAPFLESVRRHLWHTRTTALISGEPEPLAHVAHRLVVVAEGRVVADAPPADVMGRRVLELDVGPRAVGALGRVLGGRPGVTLREAGARVVLSRHLTQEHVLAMCRERRLPVLGSRVRDIRLEELVRSGP